MLAMLAFAGNSLLCRQALAGTSIDPLSFTLIRLCSGAIVLTLVLRLTSSQSSPRGSLKMALALLGYALGFSLAYVQLSAATGALILFAAVQVCMLSVGLWQGDKFTTPQWGGFFTAMAGLIYLLMPGVSAPPVLPAALMSVAGICWGFYSLWGKQAGQPLATTTGNFLLAAPISLLALCIPGMAPDWDWQGVMFAVLSGALTSGLGYAIWYHALAYLQPTSAATIQLSVPVITAILGVMLLAEPLTPRLILSAVAILGGILLVIRCK
ncbi:membrane protein [Bowmanella sp. JS7-9]|nr:membrane protein [Bowmanella sp. JS7-9]